MENAFTDLLTVGQKVNIYFDEGNINNMSVEVRATVDNQVVVYKTSKGSYRVDPLSYWEQLFAQGILRSGLN